MRVGNPRPLEIAQEIWRRHGQARPWPRFKELHEWSNGELARAAALLVEMHEYEGLPLFRRREEKS